MATRIQTTRKRTLIIVGAAAFALAIAVSAFFFGGPRPGSAAPAGLAPAVAPPAAPAFGPALTLPANGLGGLPAMAANAPGGPVALGDERFVRAAAGSFGISADQLRQDLQAQGSLQGVAAQYGQDTDAGKAGLQAALVAALRDQVTGHGGGAAQADRVAQAFGQDFARIYGAAWGQALPTTLPAIPGMPLAPGMPGAAPTN
jgi:hypothetical protein